MTGSTLVHLRVYSSRVSTFPPLNKYNFFQPNNLRSIFSKMRFHTILALNDNQEACLTNSLAHSPFCSRRYQLTRPYFQHLLQGHLTFTMIYFQTYKSLETSQHYSNIKELLPFCITKQDIIINKQKVWDQETIIRSISNNKITTLSQQPTQDLYNQDKRKRWKKINLPLTPQTIKKSYKGTVHQNWEPNHSDAWMNPTPSFITKPQSLKQIN